MEKIDMMSKKVLVIASPCHKTPKAGEAISFFKSKKVKCLSPIS